MNSPDLQAAISQGMLADQPGLRRRFSRLSGNSRTKTRYRRARSRLLADISRSVERRRRRLAGLPAPAFPADLPVAVARDRIARTIEKHPVCIVCGDTGSGKTTQLPKICLSIGRGVAGYIGQTLPRRIAARGVSLRVASELGSVPGDLVGHKVRFDESVGERCYVKVMTDGILLAELQSDRMLLDYDTVIIDEAHERSLNIDFLLGYLRRLSASRPELRIIISSATIDARRFSQFFDGAPVVEVSGRTYPIEVRYRPADDDDGDAPDRVTHAVRQIGSLWREERGDILAFFPGEHDIAEASRALKGRKLEGAEILPLYARLPLAQQRRVLEPGKRRRIVLATNVAETSLTVPNVRCVVDTGVARISRYNRNAGVQRLPVEPVSRASADQRKGRCGRVGPGICVRLYSSHDLENRPEFPEPEILRLNLAAVLLQMRALGMRDIAKFPFIDPPNRRHVNDGLRLLRELGALDGDDRLTQTGKRLARLPLDPRLGRMLLAAQTQDCVAEILVIAAALSVSDPRLRPAGREGAADTAHRRYADQRSDFLTLLNLWNLYREKAGKLKKDALEAFCRKRFLSLTRMREWHDVHDQLRQIASELGIRRSRGRASYARIHKALLSGLLRNVGFLNAEREYTGVRGACFRIAPGSAQYSARAKWIMAAELVETSRLYAFSAARIRPEWIEEAAGDLIRKTYFNAHWDRRHGQCMVYEQCALYGLTIIPGRQRRYAPICPEEARRLFIRSALVDGQLDSEARFLEHNSAIIASLRRYEDRLRQPDSLISNSALIDFYEHRVPARVFDSKSFERWAREMDESEFNDLCLDMASLVEGRLPDDFRSRFPDWLEVRGYRLQLGYRFAPGFSEDGVSVVVPVDLLAEMDPGPFSWLVPGYLEEKVQALLKALPKSCRRELAPLSDVAASFLDGAAPAEDSLVSALAAHIRRMRGVEVAEADWHEGHLPDHLRMNFVVSAADGSVLGSGRDLADVQRRFPAAADAGGTARKAAPDIRASTDWSFGDLPEEIQHRRRGQTVRLYAALEDQQNAVALMHSESRDYARRAHGAGVCRLFMLTRRRDVQSLQRNIPNIDKLNLAYALVDSEPPAWLRRETRGRGGLGHGAGSLADDIVYAASFRALQEAGGLEVRTQSGFAAASEDAAARLGEKAAEISALCEEVLSAFRNIHMVINSGGIAARDETLADIRLHIANLVYRGFVAVTPYESLRHYPRYLRALQHRIDKLQQGGARDAEKVAALKPRWQRFVAKSQDHASRGRRDDELDHYRWMVEEFRVSLFAQEIGTAYPVSGKRLDRQWNKVAP